MSSSDKKSIQNFSTENYGVRISALNQELRKVEVKKDLNQKAIDQSNQESEISQCTKVIKLFNDIRTGKHHIFKLIDGKAVKTTTGMSEALLGRLTEPSNDSQAEVRPKVSDSSEILSEKSTYNEIAQYPLTNTIKQGSQLNEKCNTENLMKVENKKSDNHSITKNGSELNGHIEMSIGRPSSNKSAERSKQRDWIENTSLNSNNVFRKHQYNYHLNNRRKPQREHYKYPIFPTYQAFNNPINSSFALEPFACYDQQARWGENYGSTHMNGDWTNWNPELMLPEFNSPKAFPNFKNLPNNFQRSQRPFYIHLPQQNYSLNPKKHINHIQESVNDHIQAEDTSRANFQKNEMMKKPTNSALKKANEAQLRVADEMRENTIADEIVDQISVKENKSRESLASPSKSHKLDTDSQNSVGKVSKLPTNCESKAGNLIDSEDEPEEIPGLEAIEAVKNDLRLTKKKKKQNSSKSKLKTEILSGNIEQLLNKNNGDNNVENSTVLNPQEYSPHDPPLIMINAEQNMKSQDNKMKRRRSSNSNVSAHTPGGIQMLQQKAPRRTENGVERPALSEAKESFKFDAISLIGAKIHDQDEVELGLSASETSTNIAKNQKELFKYSQKNSGEADAKSIFLDSQIAIKLKELQVLSELDHLLNKRQKFVGNIDDSVILSEQITNKLRSVKSSKASLNDF